MSFQKVLLIDNALRANLFKLQTFKKMSQAKEVRSFKDVQNALNVWGFLFAPSMYSLVQKNKFNRFIVNEFLHKPLAFEKRFVNLEFK